MLDHFLRKLGYEPASALQLLPAEASQIPAQPAPHRRTANQVDFDRATSDSFCYRYANEEDVHYAIGQDGWAPLVVIGLSEQRQVLPKVDGREHKIARRPTRRDPSIVAHCKPTPVA